MVIDFEGFATIVGRNFIGKSATLRAINAALTNRQGTDFIRWGEKFCEVRVVVNGFDILWHKEEGNNFYVINNERFEKIGKDPPPELINKAGFSVIKISTEKINLNYAEQFYPLFLVDRQDTKGADLLTSVYGLDLLYKALELCGRDQKTVNDDLRLRKRDLQFLEQDLIKYTEFDSLIKRSALIKDSKASIVKDQEDLNSLIVFDKSIRTAYSICTKLKGVSGITIPEAECISSGIDEVSKLKGFLTRIQKLEKETSKIEGVGGITLPNSSDIPEIITDLKTLSEINTKILKIMRDLKKLEPHSSLVIPEVKDLEEDLSCLRKLKEINQKIRTLSMGVDKFKSLSDISIPEMTIDTSTILDLKLKNDKISELLSCIKNMESDIKKVSDEYVIVENSLKEYNVCPLCGK